MCWGIFASQSWTCSIPAPSGTDTNLRTNCALSKSDCICTNGVADCDLRAVVWGNTAPCTTCPNPVTCGGVIPSGALRRFNTCALSGHIRLGAEHWATVIWCENSSEIYLFSNAARAWDIYVRQQ